MWRNFTVVLLAIFFLFLSRPVSAQGAIASCAQLANLVSKLQQAQDTLVVQNIRDVDLEDIDDKNIELNAEKTESETALKKEILEAIIACSISDVNLLSDELDALRVPLYDLELQGVRNDFSEILDGAIEYYELQKESLEDIESESLQTLAASMLEWRISKYLPEEKSIKQFILWIHNQELVQTAERRFDAITNAIASRGIEADGLVSPLVLRARTNLHNAQVSTRQTRQVFVNPLYPDDAPYLLKKSLDALARLYQDFFELSKTIEALRNTPKAR